VPLASSALSVSGDFWGYRGILGDKNRHFLQVIKSQILIVKQSYTDLLTQDIKAFSMLPCSQK